MKIHYDGRVFQFQKAGGISRYFAEVISALPQDWEPVITGVEGFGENIPKHPHLKTETLPDFRPRRFRRHFQEQWWKPRLMRSVQLAHPTYYDLTSGFTYKDFKCPVVITVYDLIYALYPHLIEESAFVIDSQRRAVERADHIICISKATERDLLAIFPQAAGKTSISYLGSSFPVTESASDETDFEQPTFLYVGARGGYKNFQLLLRAFSRACETNPTLRLEVAGSRLTDEERWQLHFLKLTDRVSSSVFPSEKALQRLYRKSVALLYPSRHEGFGIPPLEAMACGTVAVTSNTTSLPEVVGDGGIMLDPTSEDDWTQCIVNLARGGPQRAPLIQRGFARVKQFSWKTTVEQHVAIYRQLVK